MTLSAVAPSFLAFELAIDIAAGRVEQHGVSGDDIGIAGGPQRLREPGSFLALDLALTVAMGAFQRSSIELGEQGSDRLGKLSTGASS